MWWWCYFCVPLMCMFPCSCSSRVCYCVIANTLEAVTFSVCIYHHLNIFRNNLNIFIVFKQLEALYSILLISHFRREPEYYQQQATTVSFEILSNSSFNYHLAILR
jgi:hypothetical protein